jgi:dienelactone hydrolase
VTRPRARRPWLALLLAVAVLAGIGVLAFDVGDPVRALRSRARPVTEVLRSPRAELGPRVERWHIALAGGDTVRALWRSAPDDVARPWTVVLMGGLHTGDRAALVLPDDTPVNVLAVDWPWRGPRSMSAARFVLSIPAIREALLRSPAALGAGLQAVARSGEADSSRIVAVGASLGAPIALASLRVSSDARALVLIDGGAGLGVLLRAEAERYAPGWIAAWAGPLAAWLVRPLEPALHAPAVQDVPTLLINALADERLPAGVIARLHAAMPHAEVRWRDAKHIRPHQSEMIGAMVEEVVAWLDRLPARHASDV